MLLASELVCGMRVLYRGAVFRVAQIWRLGKKVRVRLIHPMIKDIYLDLAPSAKVEVVK